MEQSCVYRLRYCRHPEISHLPHTFSYLVSQIGVITPYEGQRAHVVSVLMRQGTLRQDLYKV